MNDMTKPPEDPKSFPAMLKAFLPEIERALPKHMNGDRMARIALTAFRSTPALKDCDPVSVFAAVIQSAQLGLEVGLMGEAHLVPFNVGFGENRQKKCQLIPGYQGLMKLARNSGLITDIYAHEVREGDHFKITYGMDRMLEHEPLMEHGFPASDDTRGAITGFYAVAIFKDGAKAFVAMSRHDVEKIRDKSKGYIAAKQYKKESLWDTDFLSMGMKTAIRRLCKYLPKSPELAQALAMDNAAERGREQGINLKDAIEGTWAPAADDDGGEAAAEAEKKVDAKPAYPDATFAKNLPGWKKLIAGKKKTADEVIAMLVTKNTLTDEQISAITGEKDQPATEAALKELGARAEAQAISDTDIAKHLGIEVSALANLTVGQVGRAMAFIADPVPK